MNNVDKKWKGFKLPIVKNAFDKTPELCSVFPAQYDPNSSIKIDFVYVSDEEKTIEERISDRILSKYCKHLNIGDLVYIDKEHLLNIDKTGFLAEYFSEMIDRVGTVTSCVKWGHSISSGWIWEATVSYETSSCSNSLIHYDVIRCKTGIFTKTIKE